MRLDLPRVLCEILGALCVYRTTPACVALTFAIMLVCSNPATCAGLHGKGTMPTDVVMPQMGESIFEGTITKWLKKTGEKVQRDEPLFEISTDKVDAEIPAPASGILQEIKVSEGNTVQVNTVVGIIGDGSGASSSVPAKAPAPVSAPAAPAPRQSRQKPRRRPRPPPSAPEDEPDSDVRSSPLVRKLAREHNVDLAKVSGTGTGGRVTKQDVLDFVEQKRLRRGCRSSTSGPCTGLHVIPGDLVPMSQMRKIIAQRMIESRRTSAHVHCMFEVDMTRIVNLRNKLKSGFEQRYGARLTFMPFFVRAAIIALQQYPIVNSSLEGTASATTSTSTRASPSRSIGDSSSPFSRTPTSSTSSDCSAASPTSASAPVQRSSCPLTSKVQPSPSPTPASLAPSSACPSSTSRT
jgi:hypothetical protein